MCHLIAVHVGVVDGVDGVDIVVGNIHIGGDFRTILLRYCFVCAVIVIVNLIAITFHALDLIGSGGNDQ